MRRDEALARLLAHRSALYELGIEHASIFGSTARQEAGLQSDLDLLVTLRSDMRLGWRYFDLDERVSELLGVPVDLVTEPVSRRWLKERIDKDRVDAF